MAAKKGQPPRILYIQGVNIFMSYLLWKIDCRNQNENKVDVQKNVD